MTLPQTRPGTESPLANSSLTGTPPSRIAPRTVSSFPAEVEHAPGISHDHSVPLATVQWVAMIVKVLLDDSSMGSSEEAVQIMKKEGGDLTGQERLK
ncbi:hypothetical protein QFC19_000133 [Naganishia cerealis]|uniref:Uncharacterized protein n=1 Tax=Naganishia cerealis TaxID=610337 RepID=A0ACC2WR37_9TREE|nr:hypothetical protein QFC19_000133 [Naganishia cerealis]